MLAPRERVQHKMKINNNIQSKALSAQHCSALFFSSLCHCFDFWSIHLEMASGDRHSVPPPSLAQPKSWAQIASSLHQSIDVSPLHNPQILNKLKESTSTFIRLDKDAINGACMRFQHSIYGKLFGKPPPFTQVKDELLTKWSSLGEVLISDLPNGFMLI